MKFKNVGKILSIVLLVNSVPFNSLANTVSNESRYEMFKGNSITVKDNYDIGKKNVSIEGDTIVNCLGDISYINNSSTTKINESENTITIEHLEKKNTNSTVRFHDALVETGKTYTLVFDIIENTLQRDEGSRNVGKFNIVSYNTGVYSIPSGDLGLKKVVLKQPQVSTHNGKPYFEVHDTSIGKIVIKDIMILEGDWSDREIPSYFKGMKSVGQDNESGHNIEISAQNKNLFNPQDINLKHAINNDITASINDNKIILNGTAANIYDFRAIEKAWNAKGYEYINNLPAGTNLVLSNNLGLENYWSVRRDGQIRYYRDFLTIENGDTDVSCLVRVLKGTQLNDEELKIQVETGIKPTEHINYNQNKKDVLLKEPLRGLPNGVKDRIIKRNNQWVVERNCAEITYNGFNSIWQFYEDVSDEKTSLFQTENRLAKQSDDLSMDRTINVVSDLFVNKIANDVWKNQTLEGVCSNRYGRIGVRINNDKLSSLDSDGLNEWLKENPLTVVYQLPKPYYEPLNIEPTLSLYKDVTYLSNNSIIPCEMSVTVDRTLNLANKYVELVKDNPTTENISRARMWINLLDDSMVKDQLQAEIDDISEITDLTFEKKSATNNVDIYIKSENMLSLSLDTNSIVFNDFSGVEDVTKENAINLTVSSSLPYTINAYLESEIQNSDKSKAIDRSILNIKESSETSYKEFNSIKSKLVLKDSCDRGNNVNHSIDFKLKSNKAFEADAYKAVVKFEVEQK